MAGTVFIGDELSATGWRIAGVDVATPSPAEVGGIFAEARRRADLVVVTAALARSIAPADLEAAILAETPIVAVIDDILGRVPPPDLAGRLRSTLGIES